MSMNRRDFLKGAGATAIAAAATSVVGFGTTALADEVNGAELPWGTSLEDFENSSVVIDPITEFIDEQTYDVVVVGAGTSGLPAVLTALEEGVSVACLQKEAVPVSQGGSSTGFVMDGSNEVGIQRFLETYRKKCDYRINRSLVETYLRHSGEAIMWMNKNATAAGYPPYTTINEQMDFEDGGFVTKLTNRFGPKPENNGTMITHLSELAAQRGADFYYSTPAVQLIMENGSCVGVIGQTADGFIKFNATKGVIVAAGDFQNNESMVARWAPDLVNFDRKQINKTGDGHLMILLAGGHMTNPNYSRQMHDADSGPMGGEPFLALDANGNRFMNEEITTDNWNCVLRTNPYPAGQFVHIWDANYPQYVEEWGGNPAPENQLLAFTPGSGMSAEEGGVPTGINENLIDTHFADTLEDLAEQLRVPADALVASVERYNQFCADGFDADFGKEAKYLKPIDTPPFWGVRRNIRITAICGGIAVDGNYQVLDADDNPIPGLYSAGFNAGDMCGAIDWSTWIVGMSCGTCMTSGRVAACHCINDTLDPTTPTTWEEMSEFYQNFGKNGGLSASVHGGGH